MSLIKLDYTVPQSKSSSIPNPPGYLTPFTTKQSASASSKHVQANDEALAKRARQSTELRMKRAWDLALSPAKSLPMQAIMLYFSGSGIQIFSLGMIFMLLTQPIFAVLNIFQAFEPFRPTPSAMPRKGVKVAAEESTYAPLIGPMVIYVACQGLVLALGLYKCSSMGILPTGSGDWLHFEIRSNPPEWSAIRSRLLG
ncbi:endoplasmic reticulum protein [Cryptococcus deuterogattii 99/473]|uniref:ER membrane protein complex subunit 4 n=1 Tax=Cryptococcus deuterogattii Ram5 TaxID=1296110 RepID=A0A0D0V6Y9_9TREE|nr:endoplasmic reticulum protein [Cryptococcus deuterogattii LA55]KIR33748.1 endoplasmic reticulum protein [Cryptococcus deuterogattii MMRL2647]KIR40700.1 endoplasmic reticulum protein [Cryptococcus deuterogattii Ram5]KIR94131.1 endoplasmic reticulum protein [Cryptococcus deuterogattii CBS 10090]KIS01138.1 endoplasmic reticulum protein [Cryptococcus deuterogattii 2001/935-1]KIY58336.1 endoplasmic reticulum protein [Cryptococcus deuterogattii 99/473]